jgi:hypothetical protein
MNTLFALQWVIWTQLAAWFVNWIEGGQLRPKIFYPMPLQCKELFRLPHILLPGERERQEERR